MNDQLVKEIPAVQKETAVKVIENSGLDKDAQAALVNSIKSNTESMTAYSKNVASVIDAFKERLARTDVNAAEELAKIKGQSEARYKEILAQITAVKTEVYVELEKRGLATSRGSWMKNFNAGFIEIGGQRVPVVALIISLALAKQTSFIFNESGDQAEQTWTDFLYSTSGKRHFAVPAKPLRMVSGNTQEVYFDNLRRIYVVDNTGSPIAGKSVVFFENVKPLITDINIPLAAEVKATSPVQRKGMLKTTIMLEVLAGIGTGAVIIEYDKEYAIHPTIDVKAILVQLGALAVSTVNGTAGLATSLLGQGVWDKFMGDAKAAPFITKE